MKLHEHLDELKSRFHSQYGDHVPLLTKDVIELIEERNALYEALDTLLEYDDRCSIEDALDMALAALAKARGEA